MIAPYSPPHSKQEWQQLGRDDEELGIRRVARIIGPVGEAYPAHLTGV